MFFISQNNIIKTRVRYKRYDFLPKEYTNQRTPKEFLTLISHIYSFYFIFFTLHKLIERQPFIGKTKQ